MHEMRQHLADQKTEDPQTGVPIIDLESFCCGKHDIVQLLREIATLLSAVIYSVMCSGAHGFSALIVCPHFHGTL